MTFREGHPRLWVNEDGWTRDSNCRGGGKGDPLPPNSSIHEGREIPVLMPKRRDFLFLSGFTFSSPEDDYSLTQWVSLREGSQPFWATIFRGSLSPEPTHLHVFQSCAYRGSLSPDGGRVGCAVAQCCLWWVGTFTSSVKWKEALDSGWPDLSSK